MCAWWVYALLKIDDPTVVPALTVELLKAARYTTGHLDPIDQPDPLDDIVRYLLLFLENNTDAGYTAQIVIWMFSGTSPADRRIVVEVVLGDR